MTPTGTPLPDYGIPDAASREEMSKLEWTSEGEERAERSGRESAEIVGNVFAPGGLQAALLPVKHPRALHALAHLRGRP